jgi:hypothetical protein
MALYLMQKAIEPAKHISFERATSEWIVNFIINLSA